MDGLTSYEIFLFYINVRFECEWVFSRPATLSKCLMWLTITHRFYLFSGLDSFQRLYVTQNCTQILKIIL